MAKPQRSFFSFTFFIAFRYLFSKKKRNIVNLISAISVIGVAVVTMALIVSLSVFNGLEGLVKSLFNAFDPDLKITLVVGKTISDPTILTDKLETLEFIEAFSCTLEDNVLLEHEDRQCKATLKGVDDAYVAVNGIDTMVYRGEFFSSDGKFAFALPGYGISKRLSANEMSSVPVNIYVPKRSGSLSIDPSQAFNIRSIMVSGVFAIQAEFDDEYMLVPLQFAQSVFEKQGACSAIEIKLKEDVKLEKAKKQIAKVLPEGYRVLDRYEQHETLYKIMKSEKWAIFMILSFIVIIASFNVTTSLTMLIIEKKKDISILSSMGTTRDRIKKIFLTEGMLISYLGGIVGLFLGFLFCYIQIHFGIIRLPSEGSYLLDSYPVEMQFFDFVMVLVVVIAIGFISAWYPARLVEKQQKPLSPVQ